MEIEDFFKIYQDAAWNKNPEAMINLYNKDALIFDMWDQGYISNTKEWNNSINDWLGSLGEEKVKVEFEMIKIHHSGNVGFATALIMYQAISSEGAVLRSMKNRITLGFSKIGDKWKVTHQHTSAPISSDDLSAILDI
jgi:ketosteroid isomerase-like protein